MKCKSTKNGVRSRQHLFSTIEDHPRRTGTTAQHEQILVLRLAHTRLSVVLNDRHTSETQTV